MSIMVIQSTIDSLKQRPKEERAAVARGVAIAVVVLLLIFWSFFFFRNISIEMKAGIPQANSAAANASQTNSVVVLPQINQ